MRDPLSDIELQGDRSATAHEDPNVSCPQNVSLLALQAGGDLTGRQAAVLRRHLDGCAGCRRLLVEFRETRQWVRTNLSPPVDAALLAQLRLRLGGRLARERPFPWLLAVLGRAWASWRGPEWQPLRGLAVASLLVVGAVGALPSLNGRLLQHGGFPALQPAADARPAAAGTGWVPFSWQISDPDEPESDWSENEVEADLEAPLGPDAQVLEEAQASAGDGLRIEMQTRDPNVRIIWFAAHSASGATPSRGP
jgi:anti-sigma factor RsiW